LHIHHQCIYFLFLLTSGRFLIKIAEEIIQGPIHLDVEIDGNVDGFYLNGRHLHVMPGLDFMAGAARQQQKGKATTSTKLLSLFINTPLPLLGHFV
jgi:hypothetical protein